MARLQPATAGLLLIMLLSASSTLAASPSVSPTMLVDYLGERPAAPRVKTSSSDEPAYAELPATETTRVCAQQTYSCLSPVNVENSGQECFALSAGTCVPCPGAKGQQHIDTESDFDRNAAAAGFFNDCIFQQTHGPNVALPSGGRTDVAIWGTFTATCRFSDVCGHPFCKSAVATIQGVKYRVFGAVTFADPAHTDPDQSGPPRADCTAPFQHVEGGADPAGKASVASTTQATRPAYNSGYSVTPTKAWQGDAVVFSGVMNIAQHGQFSNTEGLFQFAYFENSHECDVTAVGSHPVFYDHMFQFEFNRELSTPAQERNRGEGYREFDRPAQERKGGYRE